MKSSRSRLYACLGSVLLCASATARKPLQVFVLAGDENVLEQGIATGPEKPGTLEAVLATNPQRAFLRDMDEQKFPSHMPLDQYEKNPRTIAARLKKTGATLIWARTTPVMDETPGWKAADIHRYNAVADKVMRGSDSILTLQTKPAK